jgi:hypothetical protein
MARRARIAMKMPWKKKAMTRGWQMIGATAGAVVGEGPMRRRVRRWSVTRSIGRKANRRMLIVRMLIGRSRNNRRRIRERRSRP